MISCIGSSCRHFMSKPKLTCYNFLLFSRNKSNKSSKKGSKSKRYSETLNLPKTSFPLSLREGVATKRELEIQKTCAFDKLYQWQQEQDREANFVLHDGPPYANGKPHVGHAVNKILKDITNRFKLMQGYKVHYVPGWDCHGLPIELKAVNHQKELSPLEIRKKAETFARETISVQKESFKRWGVMADWGRCYTTLDRDYQVNQWEAFFDMYEKGLIYEDYMPVYWSPSSRTALAEAELEYNDQHVSRSVYVKFPLVSVPGEITQCVGSECKVSAIVWTTTPWTLPFNQAICYGKDIRYTVWKDGSAGEAILCEEQFSEKLRSFLPDTFQPVGSVQGEVLKNSIYTHPLTERKLPLLAGSHVTSGKGTGLVHTAPAHGHEDFQLAVKYGLPVDCHVDERGRYMDSAGAHLAGKTVGDDADDTVLSQLGAHVLHLEEFVHSYPYDWRTKKPVIIRASKQWFVNTSKLRDRAVASLKDVQIYPPNSEQGMLQQLGSRTYWCISRQRAWGLPIPVFYHRLTREPLLTRDIMSHLQQLLMERGPDFWWTLDMVDLLPDHLLQPCQGTSADYCKGHDILDIWFDSGTSWATVLKNCGGQADVYLEGKDQYGCWFQTSLLTSVAVNDRPPYRNLIVHGFTTDEEGRKMSKSEGNVVDPAVVINGGKNKKTSPAYGADVMRWWVAHAHLKTIVMIGPSVLDRCVEDMFNLRKSLRYLLGNLADFQPSSHLVTYDSLLPQDQYMLHLLHSFADKVTAFYDGYSYNQILRHLEKFINTDMSRFYFTITKDRCYCGASASLPRRSTQTVQYHLLDVIVRSLAPILPHLAEEVYLHHPGAHHIDGVKSIFRSGWFDLPPQWNNPAIAHVLEPVFTIKDDINQVLGNENPLEFDAVIFASHDLAETLKPLQEEQTSTNSPLNELLQLSHTSLVDAVPTVIPDDAHVVDGVCKVHRKDVQSTEQYKLILMASEHHICERCRRYTSSSASTPCERCLDVVAAGWEG
ncbi:isoleucine--tRNA ligase, mitochondrial-like isoform X1 [Haliotis rufescens]|uniref:isoleucine--tRNA ligase, mitochondrial-like isoform X1 n=2 Tax=Haliotis rufescens TaxID=6454 RepID=UPI00201F61BD|nr:isoleucine--tRNA ligase, mitochondrial-like isoform X1 [Haliotis rufescens]